MLRTSGKEDFDQEYYARESHESCPQLIITLQPEASMTDLSLRNGSPNYPLPVHHWEEHRPQSLNSTAILIRI
jgi:hypothetical protein